MSPSVGMIHSPWEYLLGSCCVLCEQAVDGRHGRLQLCHWCLNSLPWRPAPDLALPGFDRAFAPLAYEQAARNWVLQAKRQAGLVAARTLGILLADALADAYPFPAERPDRLIPVPLSNRRLRRRGHNQAALIAMPVSRHLKIPLALRLARRTRHTPLLADLTPEDRAGAVAGAFHAASSLAGAKVAIIDDVVTTGATARSLADALRAAGVREVHLWSATATIHPA